MSYVFCNFSDPEMDPCDWPLVLRFRACLERAGLCQPIFWLRSSTCVPVRNMQIVRQCGVRMQFAVGKSGIRLIKNILLVML